MGIVKPTTGLPPEFSEDLSEQFLSISRDYNAKINSLTENFSAYKTETDNKFSSLKEEILSTFNSEKDEIIASFPTIPTKLPNPQKLIFDGLLSGEYDGSVQKKFTFDTEKIKTISMDKVVENGYFTGQYSVGTGYFDLTLEKCKTLLRVKNGNDATIQGILNTDFSSRILLAFYNGNEFFSTPNWYTLRTTSDTYDALRLNHIKTSQIYDGHDVLFTCLKFLYY